MRLRAPGSLAGVHVAIIACLFATTTPAHATDPDDRLVDRVVKALTRHKLIGHPDCIMFVVTRNEEPGFDDVDLRERHDARCGGDPDVAPRMVSVMVDRKTGRMKTDAAIDDLANGTMSPLD